MAGPRALVLALVTMLTGAFLSVPSATASSDHARHRGFQRFVAISTSIDETAPTPGDAVPIIGGREPWRCQAL